MHKRSVFLLILAVALTVTISGCGNSAGEPNNYNTESNVENNDEETDSEVAEASDIKDDIPVGIELIEGGTFEEGTGAFYTYLEGGEAKLYCENNELVCDIKKTGDVAHGVQVYVDGFELQQGVKYEFSCDIHSSTERSVDYRFQINGGDYHAYADGKVMAKDEVQHVENTFTMEEMTDPSPRFCFNIGYVDEFKESGVDSASIEPHKIYFDNISLKVVDASGAVSASESEELSHVRVNQVGYRPEDLKYVMFVDLEADDNKYSIVDSKTNKSVYEGDINKAREASMSKELLSVAYFTDYKTDGSYKVVTSKGLESCEFVINDNAYDEVLSNAVHMLYMQRCGQELTDDYAGEFAHKTCHDTLAKIYGTKDEKDVTGGWHDAGDYGKYIVPAAKTITDMLLAYEASPGAFSDDMNIPESNNGTSDILDEAKYELMWMLKMQDKTTGGVYHKVSGKTFPGTIMPEADRDEQIVSPISNTATGDFAAVMAYAYMVYQQSDPGFAAQCLDASKVAYEYLVAHKDDSGFKNPSDIVTGEYPDDECYDELLWASAQLYKATADEKYYEVLEETYNSDLKLTDLGWVNMAGYGAYAALTDDNMNKEHVSFAKTLKKEFLSQVDELCENAKSGPYLITRTEEFEWGSNMGIANEGMIFIMADSISSNKEYVECADACRSYLMGVNATDYCFITGTGVKSPMHVHHRPSPSKGKVVAGMLSGGPNSHLEDPYAANVLKDMPPAKCYADSDQSYSCNEVAIYWNSPLIYILSAE